MAERAPAASANSTTHESAPAASANPTAHESAPKLTYHKMSKNAKLVIRSYCHVWDKNGKHATFRDFQLVFDGMKDIGIQCAEATMRRVYNSEKNGYVFANSNSWGFTTRPDLTQAFFEIEEELKSRSKPRAPQMAELEEPVIQAEGAAHHTTLPRKYFEDMKVSLRSLKGTPGFGIRTVRVAAMRVWRKHFATILPGCLTPFDWAPSDSWCYSFLHLEMKYSWRRVTGKKVFFYIHGFLC